MTASWTELLLRKLRDGTSPTALHTFFNMYVFSITGGWSPNDGADLEALEAHAAALSFDEDTAALGMLRDLVNWVMFEEAVKGQLLFLYFARPRFSLTFTRFIARKTLRRAVIMAAMRFAILSLPTNLNPEDVEIIESGVAFIKRNSANNPKTIGPIIMDEPLSLASVIMKFADERVQWMNDLSFGALNGVELGYRLEVEFTLLMLHHYGGRYAPLENVFDCGGSTVWKKLMKRKVTLVGIVERNGKYLSYSSQWKKAPALPFGYRAGSAEKLAEALELGHGFTFFFPDNNCRPDCLCLVRDEKTKRCSIVCAQMKHSKGVFRKTTGKYVVRNDVIDDAIDSVDPAHFYKRENKVCSVPFVRNLMLMIWLDSMAKRSPWPNPQDQGYTVPWARWWTRSVATLMMFLWSPSSTSSSPRPRLAKPWHLTRPAPGIRILLPTSSLVGYAC